MKKSKAVVGIIVALSITFYSTYSYAKSDNKPSIEEKSFFYLTKALVSVGDKAEMNIDLEKITYDKFTLVIQSSDNLDSVIGNNINNQEIKKNDNELIMDIDKSTSKVNTIKLQYSIPTEKKVGDKMKFTATITKKLAEDTIDENNKIDNENVTNDIVEDDKNSDIITDNQNNSSNVDEKQSVTVELTIVKKNSNDKNELENNNNFDGEQNSGNKQPNNNQGNSGEKLNQNQDNNDGKSNLSKGNTGGFTSNSQGERRQNNNLNNGQILGQNSMQNLQIYGGNKNQSSVEEVVYNGSDNNYLKKLVIKGYDLNTKFRKEKSTYFIKVNKKVKKLSFTTESESSSAKVCIYGNKDLVAGINKILLYVTAENGDVRTYRIYVNKDA